MGSGTAVFRVLSLERYRVWPAVSDLVTSSGAVVTLIAYTTVFAQVFFAPLLLRRPTRIVVLVTVTAMHAGIAVTMGLPWFSLAMIAGDAVFVRDSSWRLLATLAERVSGRPRTRRYSMTGTLSSGGPGNVDQAR